MGTYMWQCTEQCFHPHCLRLAYPGGPVNLGSRLVGNHLYLLAFDALFHPLDWKGKRGHKKEMKSAELEHRRVVGTVTGTSSD